MNDNVIDIMDDMKRLLEKYTSKEIGLVPVEILGCLEAVKFDYIRFIFSKGECTYENLERGMF